MLYQHQGEGAHSVHEMGLMANGALRVFDYGEPLPGKFSSPVCDEIGAILDVTFTDDPSGSGTLTSASCSGETDMSVRVPWLVVRRYLDELAKSGKQPADLLADEWLSSRDIEKDLLSLDTVDYKRFGGRAGSCLEVLPSATSKFARVKATAECYLSLVLIFELYEDKESGLWKIHRIRFVD